MHGDAYEQDSPLHPLLMPPPWGANDGNLICNVLYVLANQLAYIMTAMQITVLSASVQFNKDG